MGQNRSSSSRRVHQRHSITSELARAGRPARPLAARVACLTLAAFAAGLVPAPLPSALAAGEMSPGFNPALPPAFDMSKIAGQAAFTQSCTGGLQAAVQQGLQAISSATMSAVQGRSANPGAASGLGFGINAVCPGSDTGPSADSLTCDNLAPSGVLDPGVLKAKEAAIMMALAHVQCKRGKFEAVKAELQCLTAQAGMLSQQVSSIQGAYQTNIQRMQQDLAQIDSVIEDREAQGKDVLTKLGGDKENGSNGLIDVRDKLEEALNGPSGIPSQIRELESQMASLELEKKSFDEQVVNQTMGMAATCFNERRGAGFTCVPNGPPVTAKEYVLCRYEQNQRLGENGQLEESKILANRAGANAQRLATVLEQILSEVPQRLSSAPGQPPSGDPSAPAATLLTAADIENQYGEALAAFNGKGLDVHDFVMKQVGYCFDKAQRSVDQSKKLAGSALNRTKLNLEETQKNLQAKGDTLLAQNASAYERAMTALTGLNLPLTTSACRNAAPKAQIGCLQDLRGNLDGLMRGNVKQSTVKMLIKGRDAATHIQFTCQGLNGCIAALQNVDRNLKTESQRLRTFKQQYVMKARQSVDNFTKQMAAVMSSQSAALNNKLKNLNSALASLGAGGINIKPVQGEQLQVDPNTGLPIPPANALNLIGSQMNPPMLDVSGDNFGQSLAAMSDGMRELDGKAGPLNEAMNKLAMIPQQCGVKVVREMVQALQTRSDQVASGHCEWSDAYCNNESNLAKLSEAMQEIQPGGGISASDISSIDASLTAGLSGCSSTRAVRAWIRENPKTPLSQCPASVCSAGPPVAASAACRSVVRNAGRDLANIGQARSNAMGGPSGSAN